MEVLCVSEGAAGGAWVGDGTDGDGTDGDGTAAGEVADPAAGGTWAWGAPRIGWRTCTEGTESAAGGGGAPRAPVDFGEGGGAAGSAQVPGSG